MRLRPGQFPKACSRLDCFSFILNDAADTDLSNQYQLVLKYMCATECDKSLRNLESKLQQILRFLVNFELDPFTVSTAQTNLF